MIYDNYYLNMTNINYPWFFKLTLELKVIYLHLNLLYTFIYIYSVYTGILSSAVLELTKYYRYIFSETNSESNFYLLPFNQSPISACIKEDTIRYPHPQ